MELTGAADVGTAAVIAAPSANADANRIGFKDFIGFESSGFASVGDIRPEVKRTRSGFDGSLISIKHCHGFGQLLNVHSKCCLQMRRESGILNLHSKPM
jgi:hypothetical protein